MIQDIKTVFWKECKELKQILLGTRGQMFGLCIFLGVFGVLLPLQMGEAFVKAPFLMFMFSFFPLFIVIQIVPDSFAGERERHTLETLLATRLSDRGILFGKIVTVSLYGWILAVFIECIMLLSMNAIHYGQGLILPPAAVLAASFATSFLVAMLGTCLGVFFSLKAKTVKQAQQSLAMIVMVLWFLPFMVGPIVVKSISKDVAKPIIESLKQINPNYALLGIVAVFFTIDAFLLILLVKRFKRARLIANI